MQFRLTADEQGAFSAGLVPGSLDQSPGANVIAAVFARPVVEDHLVENMPGLVVVEVIQFSQVNAIAQNAARLRCEAQEREEQERHEGTTYWFTRAAVTSVPEWLRVKTPAVTSERSATAAAIASHWHSRDFGWVLSTIPAGFVKYPLRAE